MNDRPLAWHYITGQNWTLIQRSGELLPATIGVSPPERPIIWFSLHQRFEPTARKIIADKHGGWRLVEPSELKELAGGLVRIGIGAARLLAGESLRRAARMPPKIWRRLHKVGREQGANPAHWLGMVAGALPIAGLAVEHMDEAGDWIATTPGGTKALATA